MVTKGLPAFVAVCAVSGVALAQVVAGPVGGGVPVTGFGGVDVRGPGFGGVGLGGPGFGGVDVRGPTSLKVPGVDVPRVDVPRVGSGGYEGAAPQAMTDAQRRAATQRWIAARLDHALVDVVWHKGR